MALEKLQGFGKSVFFGDNAKRGDVKEFAGYLLGVKHVTKKKGKKEDEFTFLQFVERDEKTAPIVSVASSGQLNWLLLDSEGEVKSDLRGVFCQIEYKGKERVDGFPQPLKQFDVSVDRAKVAKNVVPF